MSVRSEEDRLRYREWILEDAAKEGLERAIRQIGDGLLYTWRWGDGCGGYVLDLLRAEVIARGHVWPFDRGETEVARKKDKISHSLAKAVFERDAYRCVECQSFLDLTCDHIVPESKGGETAFENLQTMCRPCNSKKGARQ